MGDRDDSAAKPGDPDRAGAPGRRQDLRIPVDADVRILQPIRARGVVLNASVGGLRIAVDSDIPVGDTCVFEVWTEGELRKRDRARVAWSQKHPDGWVIGLDASLGSNEKARESAPPEGIEEPPDGPADDE